MKDKQLLAKLIFALEKILTWLGYLCSTLMVLMLLNVFYDVVKRYVFNDVSIAMQELEWHLFAAMFMFGIAYTMKDDAHVRVDIIYANASAKYKAFINLFYCIAFALPLAGLLMYFGWPYMMDAYEIGERSGDPGGLPHRFIIRCVVPVAAFFLLLSTLYTVLINIQHLQSPNVKYSPDHPEKAG